MKPPKNLKAALETHESFLAEALEAEREMNRTGRYYAAADVFRYMTARAEGKPARRPRVKSSPKRS